MIALVKCVQSRIQHEDTIRTLFEHGIEMQPNDLVDYHKIECENGKVINILQVNLNYSKNYRCPWMVTTIQNLIRDYNLQSKV